MKKGLPRRNFLQFTIAGAAAMAGTAWSAGTVLKSPADKPGFVYRTLGRTGLRVPVISSGKIPIDNDALATAILQSGIMHIDTAHRYDDGRNEEVLGKLLKNFNREQFILATKIEEPTDKITGDYTDKASSVSFLNKFNESLRRLDTNYIDILYLHGIQSVNAVNDPRFTPLLQNLKKEGRVRWLGISTHSHIPEVVMAASDSGIYDIVLFSYNFKQNNADAIHKAIVHASEKGLGTIAMKTLAGRFLDKENTLKVNSKAALKWVLQNQNLHTVIITIKTYEQLNEYLSVMKDLTLDKTEKQFLDAHRDTAHTLFCSGCKKCTGQCLMQLPVPDIMRAYMYAYGYHENLEARKIIDDIPLSPEVCNRCSQCLIDCPSGFDVQQKIADIIRIKKIPYEFLT